MKKKYIVTLLISVILLVGCAKSKLGEPEIKSVSHNWGEITDKTTEIVTSIVVYNPNPVPVPIKSIQVEVYMNGIKMGEGKNIGPAELKPSGDTIIKLSTKIDNTKIPEWWVSHLKNGEITEFSLKGNIVFDLKVIEFSWPFEQNDEFHTDILSEMKFDNLPLDIGPIQLYASMFSRWGSITDEKTEIVHEITFHNPNVFPIPVTRMDYEIWMNNIKIGKGTTNNPAWLAPKSDTKLVFKTEIDNTKLDDWWLTHLQRGEKSTVRTEIMPVIEVMGQKFRFTLLKAEDEITTNLLGT